MMNKFTNNLHQVQSQQMGRSLVMTTQMKRNLSLLTSSIQELQHEISLEIEKNPALEIVSEPNQDSIDHIEASKNKTYTNKKQFEFVESLLTMPETLAEHLIWQLHMEDISEREIEVGEVIINNLDANGFFIESPHQLGLQLVKASKEEVDNAINIIRGLDPIGCATTGVINSLDVQLSKIEIEETKRVKLRACINKIAELYKDPKKFSELEIEKTIKKFFPDRNIKEYLKLLMPYPGRAYAYNHLDREIHVIPDAIVVSNGEELNVRINNDFVPVLAITDTIQHSQKSEDKAERDLALNLINSANSFIQGLAYRANTLEKVILYIVEHQKEFFLGRKKYIKPLTRKEISQHLALHESTISRIISNKYIQTDRGLFKLNKFISHKISSEELSSQQIILEIDTIITELQTKNQRVTDMAITEQLNAKGINIARRTVAKYRNKIHN